jgi:hypothetical protein
LQAQLDGINDPNALIPAIEQFTGKSIDLLTGTVTDPASAAPDSSGSCPASPASPAATLLDHPAGRRPLLCRRSHRG